MTKTTPHQILSKRVGYDVGGIIDGRYELRRELGRGAAGLVFEAVHCFTHRDVAIKIVAPDVSYAIVDELRARLIREARALAARKGTSSPARRSFAGCARRGRKMPRARGRSVWSSSTSPPKCARRSPATLS